MNIIKLELAQNSYDCGAAALPPSSFLQTPFWADFKAAHGWKPLHFLVSGSNGAPSGSAIFLTVLVRRFSRIASIAYVPLGPDIVCENVDDEGRYLSDLANLLKPYLPADTLCIRFDPPWGTVTPNIVSSETEKNSEHDGAIRAVFPPIPGKPVRPAPANIQPPDTVQLDLTMNSDALLAGMKPKWRYNIRLGEKKGVTVRFLEGTEGAGEGVDRFYELYLETAKRDGIAIHSKEYYADLVRRGSGQQLRTHFDKPVSVRVYLAEHEGDTLASIITLFCGEEAVYLYGASSNKKRNLMPAYSLQWHAINDATLAGCKRYDFYGIPPEDDPSHPMYGLYRFKTGFGGSIIHRVGSLDIPIEPIRYGLYRIFEAIRSFWFKKLVKMVRRETQRKS